MVGIADALIVVEHEGQRLLECFELVANVDSQRRKRRRLGRGQQGKCPATSVGERSVNRRREVVDKDRKIRIDLVQRQRYCGAVV